MVPFSVPRDLYARDRFEAGLSPAVTTFLGCCEYFADRMASGTARGETWVYSNSSRYVPQATSFDEMVASGHLGANCAMISNWGLMDIGAMPDGTRFWGDATGGFANQDTVMPVLDPACVLFDLRDRRPTFAQLSDEGMVRPGDIFLCNLHTFVYRGHGTFYACGHETRWHADPDARTEDPAKAVFETWIMDVSACSNRACRVNFLLRLRDDFAPTRCRRADGVRVDIPEI